MSEWLDINNAPPDVRVEIGRYELSLEGRNMPPQWRVNVAVVRETKFVFFGRKYVSKTCDGERFSHYRLLPAPPGDANA